MSTQPLTPVRQIETSNEGAEMDSKKSRIVASIPMTEVDGVHGTLVVHFNPDATKEAPMSSNETPKPDPAGHTAITETAHGNDHGNGGGHEPPPGGNGGHGDDHGKKHESPPPSKPEQGKGGGDKPPTIPPRPPRENDGGFPLWLWGFLLVAAVLVGVVGLLSDGCDGCNTLTPRPSVTATATPSTPPAPTGFQCPADIPSDLRGVWSPYCEVANLSDEAATRRCGEIRVTDRTGGRRCSELALYTFLVRTGHLVDAASTASSARTSELGQ